MKVGDKITVTQPAWLTCKEGTIKDIIETPAMNYYVVAFPDGLMYSYKEEELIPMTAQIKAIWKGYNWLVPNKLDRQLMAGYVRAYYDLGLIKFLEWDYLTSYINGDVE